MLFSKDKIPFPAENAEICIKRIPKYTSSDVYFSSQSLIISHKFQKSEIYGRLTPLVAKNLWDDLVESYRTEIKYLGAIRFQKRSLSDDSLILNVTISFQLVKSTGFQLKRPMWHSQNVIECHSVSIDVSDMTTKKLKSNFELVTSRRCKDKFEILVQSGPIRIFQKCTNQSQVMVDRIILEFWVLF